MPHSTRSTRTPEGYRACPYCGRRLIAPLAVVCSYCTDLPALEPFDDRYLLREDEPIAVRDD